MSKRAQRARRHFCAVVVFGLLIGLSTVLAQENSNKPKKLNPYAGNPEAVAEGEKLYRMLNCYGCHGMRGGGGKPHNFPTVERRGPAVTGES